MALKIVWTRRATQGYDKIIKYLQTHFADKEIRKFIKETNEFLDLLKDFPEILMKSKMKGVYRGPINSLTIIIYRVKPRKGQIEIINIRSARQKPLKKY